MRKWLPLLLLLCLFCMGNSSTDYDGTNDYVSYGAISELSGTNDQSALVWFHCDSSQDGSFISDFNTGNGQGMTLRCDASGFFSGRSNVITYAVDDGTLEQLEGNTNSQSAGNWQWAAGTADIASPDEMRLYVDGTEQSDSPRATNLVSMGVSGTAFRSGTYPNDGVDLNGKLAYLQMWNRVLPFWEVVQAAYCPGTVPEGLYLYDPMWEGASTHQDLSGQDHDGTVTNNPTGSNFGPPGVSMCGGYL